MLQSRSATWQDFSFVSLCKMPGVVLGRRASFCCVVRVTLPLQSELHPAGAQCTSPGTQPFCLGDVSEEKQEKPSLLRVMCDGVIRSIPKKYDALFLRGRKDGSFLIFWRWTSLKWHRRWHSLTPLRLQSIKPSSHGATSLEMLTLTHFCMQILPQRGPVLVGKGA